MPSATSIVARSYPDKIIGVENRLPWHLGTDLKLFKERTQGHAIIMGRKTLESIGRPLPNRTNIVLSRTAIEEKPGLKWAQDVSTALFLADIATIYSRKEEFFVIGGEQIYSLFSRYINNIYLTDVFCGPINGDAKFEVDFSDSQRNGKNEWISGREDEYPRSDIDDFAFRITKYRRRVPMHRYRMKEEFMGRDPNFLSYFETYQSKLDSQVTEEQNTLEL
jgi:dihydrofolate reductase